MKKPKRPQFKNLTDSQLLGYYSLMLFQQQIAGLASKTFDHPLSQQAFQFAQARLDEAEYACSKRTLDTQEATDLVIEAVHSQPKTEEPSE